jgi:hypothetical protein
MVLATKARPYTRVADIPNGNDITMYDVETLPKFFPEKSVLESNPLQYSELM